ncbi:MAG: hypothetical protein J0H91_01960 [Rhodospirillales bacterium]|nr:hypothetical protein [Rhodospirillales bacterium]
MGLRLKAMALVSAACLKNDTFIEKFRTKLVNALDLQLRSASFSHKSNVIEGLVLRA